MWPGQTIVTKSHRIVYVFVSVCIYKCQPQLLGTLRVLVCSTLIPVSATTILELRSGVCVNDRVHGARVPSPRHESIESCNYITTREATNRAEFRSFHIRRDRMALNITLIIGTCRLCDGTFMYPSEPVTIMCLIEIIDTYRISRPSPHIHLNGNDIQNARARKTNVCLSN